MKYWKYEMQNIDTVGIDNDGNPVTHESFLTKYIPYTVENEELAKQEAYNGEYTVEDDGVEETVEPTQLDRVEAQVAYTAMMTDTLLEV